MKKVLIAAAAATMMLPAAAMAERDGAAVYSKTCVMCHAAAGTGAPVMGNAEEWAPRAATGIEALMVSATKGKGAMPPKGLCMDCTDGELQAAVQYMLDNSK
ncbi:MULTISPECIES: c-type cytochrome [unclassified Neptuniibacter]|uniref:c-type cytochrome n=1 Tax=unclassified Neptuniibacter TaxID=2630693 RepID=UPI000C4CEB8B|nr:MULTISPECIES: c-type cytochrome [unclassified Neptuniibacter]MAY43481.1 cytochrome c5 family protein [Oceanospirillaceae bacterium]|tara:strand:+ start:10169 stop:10474 length:306 start_codon:yes stop_codon:yes gene_type:complete